MADPLSDINRQLDAVEGLCLGVMDAAEPGSEEHQQARLHLGQVTMLRGIAKDLDRDALVALRRALIMMSGLYDDAALFHWGPMQRTLEGWQQKRSEGGKKGRAARAAKWDKEKPRLRAEFDKYRAGGLGPDQARGRLIHHHQPCPTDKTLQRWGFKDKD